MADKSLADIINDHQAGRLEQAEAGYRRLLENDPDNADAIHLLGVVFFQKGNLDAAREQVIRAISLNAGVALYFTNLGRIEKALDQITAAIEAYRQSLKLAPDQADVNSDIAAALVDAEEFAEALGFAERAIKLLPEFAAAHFNRGMALLGLGQQYEAITAFEETLRLDRGFADAHFQLGRMYQDTDQPQQAEQAYRRVLQVDPTRIEARCNLGNILRADVRLNEAVQLYDQALALSPDVAEIHSNKGVALHELGEREGAIGCYRRAIKLDPDDAETHRNLSMALLQGGEFGEGWKEFEWRWQTRHFAHTRRDWDKPQWFGEALNGQTVLVHAEQGFGDSFQFCRFIPLIAERGGRVILEAPYVAQDVLGTVGEFESIISPGNPLPLYDYHIPMMSLPGTFETTIDTIPSPGAYLSVPVGAEIAWREKLKSAAGKKRVGIVWKGNSEHSGNLWRSPGLEVFRSLLTLEHVEFYSLQKDDGEKDLHDAGLSAQVVDLHSQLNTFSDTAAVIDQLDLVITPDTSVAHLSGALGCPTWIMLPHVAEWRWGIGREDSPWYPDARLFRQSTSGDWERVISKIRDELQQF